MAAVAQDVRNLTGLSADVQDAQIDPFLAIAATVISGIETCLTGKGITDTDQLQAALASHYIALSPIGKAANLVVEEKFENWSSKLSTGQKDGKGYASTSYGEMAEQLAFGCLNQVGMRTPSIEFF